MPTKRSGLSKGRVYALLQHLKAREALLIEELEMLFDSTVPVIPDHTNYFDAVEDKLLDLSEYQGALEALSKNFMED